MMRRMYDLAGIDPAVRFSPFCWRIRLALAHKGLPVETIPWRFTEAALAPARATLEMQPHLGGERPSFADHCLMGAFMWARCVSAIELLPKAGALRRALSGAGRSRNEGSRLAPMPFT